jgi:hypothetical protein
LKNFITRYKSAIILLFVVIGLIGCATQPLPTGIDPPGFWMGIAHGFLIFFSMIGSFFSDIRIYAYPNAGPCCPSVARVPEFARHWQPTA